MTTFLFDAPYLPNPCEYLHNPYITRNYIHRTTFLLLLIHPCDRQMDRQTDGIAMAYTRYSIYAVACNKSIDFNSTTLIYASFYISGDVT